MANLHDILDRHKDVDILPGRLEDFTLGPAQTADANLAAERPWSFYCLDIKRDHAVFVELPEDNDLADAPFSGVTQFRLAKRALVVPLAALDGLAARGPRPQRTVLLYSIGRCGSTLAVGALNAAPSIWALSEPWPLDPFQHAAEEIGIEAAARLLRTVMALLFRPPPTRRPTILVVKFRSQTLFAARTFRAAVPEALNVFLYREAIGWANSRYLTGQRITKVSSPEQVDLGMRTWKRLTAAAPPSTISPALGIDPEKPSVTGSLAAAWTASLHELESLRAEGMAFFALRYDDLTPEGSETGALGRLFDYSGAPRPSRAALAPVFARDSQAGTSLARGAPARPLDASQRADLIAILARHPRYATPDLRIAERS